MTIKATPEDIHEIAGLVSDLCGIVLDESKGYLIESRLSGIAEANDCTTFSELCVEIRFDNNQKLKNDVIDAITTNETLFFRDESHYEALHHKAIPELIDAKAKTAFPKRLRLWSAACSTGQEPYSLAILLHELIPNIETYDIQILATDISDAAIQQASSGCYSNFEIERGMNPESLNTYFEKTPKGWKVKDRLRSLVQFKKMNLLQPFNQLGMFDVVFCRNVAIYFDGEGRRDLFERIVNQMTPEGVLIVGSSESLMDLGPQFEPQHYCRAIFYQPHRVAAPV